VITLTLLLWVGVSIGAYFAQTKSTFFAVAVTAGLGLGSIQAASRALMASLIPPGKESELFGFYALCGKSSSVLGPLVFGAVVLPGRQSTRRGRRGRRVLCRGPDPLAACQASFASIVISTFPWIAFDRGQFLLCRLRGLPEGSLVDAVDLAPHVERAARDFGRAIHRLDRPPPRAFRCVPRDGPLFSRPPRAPC